MDFNAYILASPSFPVSLDKFRQLTCKTVLGNFISAILSLIFATVGTLLGLITGAMLGKKQEFGIVRGGILGAVSGGLSSIDVFISFRRLWESGDKGIQILLYLVRVLVSLVNGRLIQERINLIIFNPIHSQVGINEAEEVLGVFDIGGCKGLSVDIVNKIPMTEVTSMNQADSYGEIIPCSVCLQDFQLGEMVRELCSCQHMFHQNCIDQWLIQHCSCPLCRRQL